ncbi:MAG: Tim44 domain-containing protein [Alphaproteobacteria bacterium]|nr:Tim44 domain-containing protein [Alphaproteobacteria bacterium]
MDPVLLILAGVTAFILFRLISVMGTRTGHEQRQELNPSSSKSSQAALSDAAPDETTDEAMKPTPVSTNARVLRDADPAFDESVFLEGARSAYETIVEAFADGDLQSIRSFLSDTVYGAFKQGVVAREEAGHVSDLKFVGIDRAAIVDSSVDDAQMIAVVEFTSNQVRVTRDKDGNIIDGDPIRIDLVKDRWSFSRRRDSKDPNWKLVATGGGA